MDEQDRGPCTLGVGMVHQRSCLTLGGYHLHVLDLLSSPGWIELVPTPGAGSYTSLGAGEAVETFLGVQCFPDS